MPWGIAAGAIGAAAIGAAGSESAANTQANADKNAANTQLSMFNTINQQEQPFIQSGYGANAKLNYLLGVGPQTGAGAAGIAPDQSNFDANAYLQANPDVAAVANNPAQNGGMTPDQYAYFHYNTYGQNEGRQFTYNQAAQAQINAAQAQDGGAAGGAGGYGSLTGNFTGADYLANQDPGYQFQLQTGGQALRNSDTPGVGALSGAALKDLMSFNQNMAATGYQNAYNRWQTTNSNIFARLSGIAGLGQNAASNVGTQGTALGTGAAQAEAAAGAASAAGTVGATNALGNAASTTGLSYLLAGQGNNNAGSAVMNAINNSSDPMGAFIKALGDS